MDASAFGVWVSGWRDPKAEAERLRTTLADEYEDLLQTAVVCDDLAQHLAPLTDLRARLDVLDDLIKYHTKKGEMKNGT